MLPRPGGVSSAIAPPPPPALARAVSAPALGQAEASVPGLEAAVTNRESACVSLRPGNAAMAGVLSRDTPDIEVPTAVPGWEGHRGAEAWGRARGTAGDSLSFPRGDLSARRDTAPWDQELVTS